MTYPYRVQWVMRIVPNPVKEASNRRKHGLDFSGVGEMLCGRCIGEPDDRPLGYEHEARVRVYGVLDLRAVVLIYEPVELAAGEIGVRPISLRYATRTEAQMLWEQIGQ